MKVWSVARSKRLLQCVSLAVLLCLAAAVSHPASVRAEEDNSLFSQLRLKKRGVAQPATTGHSMSSGIPATTETRIVNDGSVAAFITPDSPAQIQAMADKYARIVASGGWPEVPRGRSKKGSKGNQVASLNQRLYVEGYLQVEATQGEFQQLFTSATEEALKRFQVNHGLAASGVIDGVTLAALNVPAQRRLATIKANIPRLAEYSRDLGPRYVVVNVPAQQIETVEGGKVYSLHNAIVGRPSRPTPVVMTPLTIVRFNPYWNAPASIVERDIVPRMQSRGASKVLADMNIKVFDGVGGPEVDPDKINWRSAKIADYHFRQEPGGDNAMATAKIEFTSPFGIYLHDTPEPQLFQTANRFYSSGCVRVDKVAIMLEWILQGQDGLNASRIAELAQSRERLDVNILNAPQLRVAYLTAWPAKDGVAAFREDVYEMDGTGFVVGQPLPVGEKMDGQRFVLKPIPYLQQDIDTNDAGGFLAVLFRGKSARDQEVRPGQNKRASDSLINLAGKPGRQAASGMASKTAKANGPSAPKRFLFGSSKNSLAAETGATAAKGAKKKVVQKKGAKSLATTAKPPAKPASKTAAAAPKAAPKTKPAATATAKPATPGKKPVSSAAAATPSAKPAATAAAKPDMAAKPAAATAAKSAASCKPGSDGKLPGGCPAPKPSAATTPAKPAAAAKTATN